MSRRQIIECDRCGSIGDEETDREQRGRVFAATLTGVDRVGNDVVPADLCGPCMDSLVEFMKGEAE